MLIRINDKNIPEKSIAEIVNCIKNGGVIIYPTDTVYALGGDITQPKVLEKICKLKGIKLEKANFSFVCSDLSHISDYVKPISNEVFRVLKRTLPGPFTFIFNANSSVPKLISSGKKTVGIRVPDNTIARQIVRVLGNPIISTSIHDDDAIVEYSTDPELIHERFQHVVDLVIDGGYGDNEPSTVVDCTSDDFNICRQGKGIWE